MNSWCIWPIFAATAIIQLAHPLRLLGSDKADFIQFANSNIKKAVAPYLNGRFDVLYTMEIPKSIAGGIRPALSLATWSTLSESRVCTGRKTQLSPEKGASMPNVPADLENLPIAGVFLKNPYYHAHLAFNEADKYSVTRIWRNFERSSEEVCAPDMLSQLPNRRLTFADVAERSSELLWKNGTLTCLFEGEPEEGPIKLIAKFAPSGAIQSLMMECKNGDWRHDIKYTYATDAIAKQELVESITRLATGFEPVPSTLAIKERWLVGNYSQPAHREADFRLPAFGLPEPPELVERPMGWLIAVITGVCLLSLGIAIRYYLRRRK